MSGVFKISAIEGRGLGWVATTDIKKGSLILNENPQICPKGEEKVLSADWIKSLLESFDQLNKNNQDEFFTLYNKFNNIKLLQKLGETDIIQMAERTLDKLKTAIDTFEWDHEKVKKILEICCIYLSNANNLGLRLKASRINHSCQPNAIPFMNSYGKYDQYQVRAIVNIKAGQEITCSSIMGIDPFYGFRNRKVFFDTLFNCVCT